MIQNAPLSVKFDPDTRKDLKRMAQLLNNSENHIVQECVKAIVVLSEQAGKEQLPLLVTLIRAADAHVKHPPRMK
jgi:hypothetical protein